MTGSSIHSGGNRASDLEIQPVEKAREVRRMFGAIARRYDFLNHFLSGNIDRLWRRACVREVAGRLPVRPDRIADIGCGTGDLSLAFAPLGRVFGCDFSEPMLHVGRKKAADPKSQGRVFLIGADALALPFRNAGFDAVVSAFVLRNLADAGKGIGEMNRVLKPGGVVAVLDFSMPRIPLLGRLYRFYFLKVLPRLGFLISGVDGPYKYLPDSVQNFPGPEELKQLLERCGFAEVRFRLLSGGIAVLLTGIKPQR
jgi:demethylmenaquinone methyltransferase/2-methoxy-6-polyprenyl-1,4-benzoquinol methylase